MKFERQGESQVRMEARKARSIAACGFLLPPPCCRRCPGWGSCACAEAALTSPVGWRASPVLQVVNVAATFAEVWRHVSATLAQLDLLAAFAEVAAAAPAPYVRPTMLPSDGKSGL